MLCPKCNQELNENANFCSNCGANLTVEQHFNDIPEASVQEAGFTADAQAGSANTAQAPASNDVTNDMAIAGFACSFVSPALGFVFGGIGLARAMKRGGKGKAFAIAALAVSGAMFFINLFSMLTTSLLYLS